MQDSTSFYCERFSFTHHTFYSNEDSFAIRGNHRGANRIDCSRFLSLSLHVKHINLFDCRLTPVYDYINNMKKPAPQRNRLISETDSKRSRILQKWNLLNHNLACAG